MFNLNQIIDSTGISLDSRIEVMKEDINDASKKAGDMRIFFNFESIGLTAGQETIDTIVKSLPDCSILITHLTTAYGNSSIYPHASGSLTIKRLTGDSRVSFLFEREDMVYWAFYNKFNTTPFTGWKRLLTDMELSNFYMMKNLMTRKSINKVDVLTLDAGRYEGTELTNSPLVAGDLGYLEVDVTVSATRKQFIAIKSITGEMWLRTIHTDGTPTSGTNGWKKFTTT